MKKRYMHPNDDTNILDTDILDLKDELAKLTEQLKRTKLEKDHKTNPPKRRLKT